MQQKKTKLLGTNAHAHHVYSHGGTQTGLRSIALR